MKRWTRDAILAVIQNAYHQDGYISSYRWMKGKREPHFYTIIHVFGNWHAVWEAAGFDVPRRLPPKANGVTRDLIIRALQNVGQFESERVWSTHHRTPSAPAIRKLFGSWQAAWEAAGLWTPPASPADRVLARLREMGRYYTEVEWDRAGFKPVSQTIRNNFGSWTAAWEAAGIGPDPSQRRLSRDEVLAILKERGIYCTAKSWDNANLRPTSRTIRKLFGSWKDAWKTAGITYPEGSRGVTRQLAIEALKAEGQFAPAQLWDATGHRPSSRTIRKLFGSWQAAWDAAGISPARPGTSLVSPNERPIRPLNATDLALWKDRQQGKTLIDLSREFGMSTSTIARRILRARIPLQ